MLEEPVLTGRVLAGRYRLGERLGAGGWGAVYDAVQTDLGRRVAVKVLHTGIALTHEGLARFEREARSAAALGHPNIAQVTDFQANAGEPPFLVMELLAGRTLAAALRAEGRIAAPRVAWIAHQILAGLDAAHRAGIVHRDVKPDNVFLVSAPGVEDLVKLLDFGIAKLASDTHQQLTATGSMLGSPAFMAPEQIRGMLIDHRADLYAVGATMYLALSGRLAFDAANVHGMLLAITEQRPTPLSSVDPSLDPRLGAVIDRAMHKDPNARFGSAAEMRAALEPWLGPHAARVSAVSAPPLSPASIATSGPAVPPAYVSAPMQQGPMLLPLAPAAAAATGAPGRSRAIVPLLVAIVALLLLLVLGGVGAFVFLARGHDGDAARPPTASGASTAATAPTAAAIASAPSGASDASGAKTPSPGAAATPAAATPAATATATSSSAKAAAKPDAGAPRKQFAGSTNWRISGGSFERFGIPETKAAIMTQSSAIGACYAATEFDPPDHQFTDWTFRIAPTGDVVDVRRTTDFQPHPKFDVCMIAALRRVKLAPTPAGGSIRISFDARTKDNP